MRRKSLFGILAAAALTMVLAACVYDEAGAPTPGPGPGAQVLFPNITGTQTIQVSVPYIPAGPEGGGTARNNPLFAVTTIVNGPASVDHLANAHAWSNITDSLDNAGPIVLDVTFTPYRIADIRLVSHAETIGMSGAGTGGGLNYLATVYPALTDQVVFRQSTLEIDAYSGSTVTRNGFLRGINDAIELAGADPRTLAPINLNATTPPAGARFIPGQVNIYIPAGTYVVMDPTANVLDIRPVTPALALELGMVNADGSANNAGIQRHGVIHNGFRRQPTPEIDARLGLATPRAQTNPEGLYFNHYIHADNLLDFPSWPYGGGGANNRGLPLALNHTFGYNLVPGAANPFAGQPRGIWMQITFGFNSFWVNERGAQNPDDFSGLVFGGHGETMAAGWGNPHQFATGANSARGTDVPLAVQNNSMGGWWWSQVAPIVINDQQSTHNALDVQVNATMTALGVRVAVEQAMRAQGATDATIAGMTPIAQPLYRTGRPQGASTGTPGAGNAAILRPGLHTTEVAPGVEIRVLLDRAVVRHFSFAYLGGGNAAAQETAIAAGLIPGWTNENFNAFRNNVLFAYAENGAAGTLGEERMARLVAVPLMEGIDAAVAQNILDFVVSTINANDVTANHSNANLLGASSGGTGKDRLPPTPVINR